MFALMQGTTAGVQKFVKLRVDIHSVVLIPSDQGFPFDLKLRPANINCVQKAIFRFVSANLLQKYEHILANLKLFTQTYNSFPQNE